MSFFSVWIRGLGLNMAVMTVIWVISVLITNVSIVDTYWGLSFIVMSFAYDQYLGPSPRSSLMNALIYMWALRLSVYLGWRTLSHGIFTEDIRYRNFRSYWGAKYWWVSFIQTFLLQGVIGWIVSVPILVAKFYSYSTDNFTIWDALGVVIFGIGLVFESVADYQLLVFKRRRDLQPGEILQSGLWRFTRHPNYFGESLVWFGIWLVSVGSEDTIIISLIAAISPVFMTLLLLKVSGVAMMDKVMTKKSGNYVDYINSTSGFIPWWPKKLRRE